MSANHVRTNPMPPASGFDLVLTRTFDAPRELVFQVWTDPAHLAQWWGPDGFTNPVCEFEPRIGGKIRIHMHAPNGVVYPMTAVIEEFDRPQRLVFISSALDEHGHSMFDIRNTVTFAEKHGKTELRLEARVLSSTAVAPQYLKGMEIGWTQSLGRLAAKLASMA